MCKRERSFKNNLGTFLKFLTSHSKPLFELQCTSNHQRVSTFTWTINLNNKFLIYVNVVLQWLRPALKFFQSISCQNAETNKSTANTYPVNFQLCPVYLNKTIIKEINVKSKQKSLRCVQWLTEISKAGHKERATQLTSEIHDNFTHMVINSPSLVI